MDTSFAGDVVIGAVGVDFVAVRAFEPADSFAAFDRVGAFAGNRFAPLHGKALQTGLTFNEPDEGHGILANSIVEIANLAERCS
jgi:hypothetical protein